MRNFQLISQQNNVQPLLNAVLRNPQLWNQHTLRTDHPNTAHSEVDDIWLRFDPISEAGPDEVHKVDQILDSHESINYPAMRMLPQARSLIFGLMGMVEGERLGRCLITRLPPGGVITLHIDSGDHAVYYDRYHIVLMSRAGCVFKCGEEMVNMLTGDVWWFDNSVEHEVINNSDEDRIHLVVDIRTFR